MRILVVDDEESTRLLLARTLSQGLDAEVQLAGTCEQALRFAASYVYDAILLDLLMPGIGGFGVLSEIRHSSPNAATPVIMVTQVAEKDTLERCLAAGANAVPPQAGRAQRAAGDRARPAGGARQNHDQRKVRTHGRNQDLQRRRAGQAGGPLLPRRARQGRRDALHRRHAGAGRQLRGAMRRRVRADREGAAVGGRRLEQRGAVHHVPGALAGHRRSSTAGASASTRRCSPTASTRRIPC